MVSDEETTPALDYLIALLEESRLVADSVLKVLEQVPAAVCNGNGPKPTSVRDLEPLSDLRAV
jgi:hypothetical protein